LSAAPVHIGGLFAAIAVAAIKFYLKGQMNMANKLDQLKKFICNYYFI